jgi:hypothetical protein
MSARPTRTAPISDQPTTDAIREARLIPSSSAVMSIVVRVAGLVAVRHDLTHAGTPQQQLGMSLGTVLIYLRAGTTARTIAEQWTRAGVLAESLTPALVVARRGPLQVGPSTVAAMVRMGGLPRVTAALYPGRVGVAGASPMVRVQVGPVMWEVMDATAYVSLEKAWQQAAALLGSPSTVERR